MALIVCTPGGSADNCYVTLVQADAYYGNSLRERVWDSYVDDLQERALIQATGEIERLGGPKDIDGPARPRFPGAPADDSTPQALHFPRTDDRNSAGALAVPTAIQNAVCEQALWLLDRNASGTLMDRDTLRAEGVRSIAVDGLSETYGANGVPQGIAPRAWAMVSPFVARSGRTMAGSRRGVFPDARPAPTFRGIPD